MADITPITRLEEFIVDAKEGQAPAQNAITRVETFLAKIAGANVVTPSPITRIETFLASIAGETVTLPKPMTRIETFLAAIAGEDVETPEPITRVEIFLAEWAEGGGGSVVKTITGEAPITFEALAAALVSLTQDGKCTQDGTPTPSAPVDIVCNNGALRYGALGANLLDPSPSNTILGYYIRKEDGVEKDAASNFMFANYMPVEDGKTYVAYGRAKSGNDLSDYNRVAWYDSNKNWLSGADYTQNRIAVVTAPANAAYARFSCNPSGTTTQTVTQEYVDSFNWTFCEGTAEITPFVPFVGGIYTEGTPEVLTLAGNYASGELTGYGTYVSPTTTAGNRAYKWLDVPNGTYQFAVDGDYEIIVQWRDPADPSITVQKYENLSGWITSGEVTLNKPSGGYGITVRRTSGTSITPDTFDGTLYCTATPQTASVVDLFAVNDYKDTHEIVGGVVTHRVGIKVLDGTESGWALSDSGVTHRFRGVKPSDCHTPASRAPSVCTHFKYVSTGSAVGGMFIGASQYWYFIPTDQTLDTVDEWTAWLAEQYAAGTPVIVLYPLAEETTESVQGQRLHSASGANTISVVSNVDPVNLTVEYKAEPEEVDEP